MPTDRRIVFKPEEIGSIEAVIFHRFARGIDVRVRPLEDTETLVRGRLKSDLQQYWQKRAAGYLRPGLLQELLYQFRLYCAIVPGYNPEAITCILDLYWFVISLPGKPPALCGLQIGRSQISSDSAQITGLKLPISGLRPSLDYSRPVAAMNNIDFDSERNAFLRSARLDWAQTLFWASLWSDIQDNS